MQMHTTSPNAAWLYENWEVVPLAWLAVIVIYAFFHAIIKRDGTAELSGTLKPLDTILHFLFLSTPLLGTFLVGMHGMKTGSMLLTFASIPLTIPAIIAGAFVKNALTSLLLRVLGGSKQRLSADGRRGTLNGNEPPE